MYWKRTQIIFLNLSLISYLFTYYFIQLIFPFPIHPALSHKHLLNLAFSLITTITHPQLEDHAYLGNYLQFGEGKRDINNNNNKIQDPDRNYWLLIDISVMWKKPTTKINLWK